MIIFFIHLSPPFFPRQILLSIIDMIGYATIEGDMKISHADSFALAQANRFFSFVSDACESRSIICAMHF